jgi:hypothetical protein
MVGWGGFALVTLFLVTLFLVTALMTAGCDIPTSLAASACVCVPAFTISAARADRLAFFASSSGLSFCSRVRV